MQQKKSLKYFFGTRKEDKVRIYLDEPEWACGWYWSFGYLGNFREHYHLDAHRKKDHVLHMQDGTVKLLTEGRNICMYDALLADYEMSPVLLGEKDKFGAYPKLYLFCELALTAYTLKETAEVLGRGGSRTTTNPLAAIIANADEVTRINTIVLPAVFEAIDKLFIPEELKGE